MGRLAPRAIAVRGVSGVMQIRAPPKAADSVSGMQQTRGEQDVLIITLEAIRSSRLWPLNHDKEALTTTAPTMVLRPGAKPLNPI